MYENLAGKSFYIKTYGCQMNVHDSQKIAASLIAEGMIFASAKNSADVVIVNTCHIREKAEHKIYTELGFLKKIKEKRIKFGKDTLIAVGGCVAQSEGEKIFQKAPFVNIVFGTQVFHRLPEMLSKILSPHKNIRLPSNPISSSKVEGAYEAQNRSVLDIHEGNWGESVISPKPHEDSSIEATNKFAEEIELRKKSIEKSLFFDKKEEKILDLESSSKITESKMDALPIFPQTQGAAFVAIQEGCDKFCTYCVVPNTRGREISRAASSILNEIRLAAKAEIKEITLLGQNVDAYHGDAPEEVGKKTWDFPRLLYAVAEIPGIERIFFTSSHPSDVTIDLMKAYAEIPTLMPFLHLPVQSGSDEILKKMNRHYTSQDYLRIIEKFREYNPNIAFSTDIIVGFPGETEQNFEDTIKLVEKVQYSQAFSFSYSRRPGTVAWGMSDQIPEKEKAERLYRLQNLLKQQQTEFNKNCIGKTLSAMFQKYGKHENQILGKSEYMQSVIVSNVNPDEHMLSVKKVKIQSATLSCVEGVFVLE